jgi:uroporphyrinogen decarboxylase
MLNYFERYQPDVVLAYNDLAKEAEAFGCRVKYSDYVVPSIDVHVLAEDKARLATLAMPDPYRTARLPGFLEQCEALVNARPPTAIGAVAVGPWTIAMLLRNPETMLLDTFEDPQFIHDLMRVATDFCKLWGDAIVKTGIGLSFSEPTASISLI